MYPCGAVKPEPQPTWYGTLKDAAKYSLLCGLLFAVFRYFGHFSMDQSVTLAWVIGTLAFRGAGFGTRDK
jgi:hypothetical protein